MLKRVLCQVAYGLAILSGGTGVASAGSFAVSPVRATLSASLPVDSMIVRNNGAAPSVVQLEVMAWSQQDGKDVYIPTKDVLATPPIFTVQPGKSQVVRVGLRRPPDQQGERTYRLFLQEVPPPPTAGGQGLQVALRLGVPVFVKPATAAAPALHWQASRTPQGKLKLSLNNDGNAHIQVTNFKLTLKDGAELASQQVVSYLLPGQSRDWLLRATVPQGTSLRIHAQTDAGDVQDDVVIAQP